MEVVPDNETFWSSQEEFSCNYFPGFCWTKRAPLESKPSERRGLLYEQHGSGEAIGECD